MARATMPATGDGLRAQPTCRGCDKKLRPHVDETYRLPTDAELAHEEAARAERDAAVAPLKFRYDNTNELTTAEYARAVQIVKNRYEQRRILTPGVVVHMNEYNPSSGPMATEHTRTGWGYFGNGEFHSQRCAAAWAESISKALRVGTHRLVRT